MKPADRRRNPQFTVAEVAAMVGVKPFTVRQWIVRGHLHRNARGKIDGRELVAYLGRRGDRGQHARQGS